MKIIKDIVAIFILNASFCFAGGSVTYKEGQHIPLVFIINRGESEGPLSKSLANTDTLNFAIQAQESAILVSRSILYNFIYRKQNLADTPKTNNGYKDTPFSANEWELYKPIDLQYFSHNNQLYLLIPRIKKDIFAQAFNFKIFHLLNMLPSKANSSLHDLIKELQPKAISSSSKSLTNLSEDLEKIFTTISISEQSLSIHQAEMWKAPIFDIYLNGHGSPKPSSLIASFTPSEIQKLLTFFNNKIRIGVLIVSSCFSGGENLQAFKFKTDVNDEKIFNNLNFIIIANSVGDISKFAPTSMKIFKLIFYYMQHLEQNKNLKSLLLLLGQIHQKAEFPHAEAQIPQIILPGGIAIQSLTPSNKVLVLEQVKVKASELENKSIFIDPKNIFSNYDDELNVLIYPQIINIPLIIRASHIYLTQYLPLKGGLKHLPSFSDLITNNKITSEQAKALFGDRININYLNENYYLYPNILSMIHGNAAHYFKNITFTGNAFDGSGGIIMGIRDSFFYISERPTSKTFYIDEVDGSNDISLILKTIRLLHGNAKKESIEEQLPNEGEIITLRNVIITTQGEQLRASIKFQFNKTAWKFDYDEANWSQSTLDQKIWNFIKIDTNDYEKEYQKSKNKITGTLDLKHQKSLKIILKEKETRYKEFKHKLTINNLFELSSTLEKLATAKR